MSKMSRDYCTRCKNMVFTGSTPQESAAKLKAHYAEKHP